MRLMIRLLLAAVVASAVSLSATAAYPDRPVTLVNPYAAGGPADVVAQQPIMLVVNPTRGIRTVSELIAQAKAAPGKLSYGSAGVGGATHLGAELFQHAAQVQLNHIPYAGASPAINDVVGGQTDLAMLNLSASLPFIRQGRLLALAYASDERSPLLPDVPTLAEAGVPGAEAATWYSLAAPAGTPAAIVQTLSDTVRAVNEDPDYRRVMQEQAIALMALSPRDAQAYVARDQTDMRRLLGTLGLLAK